MRTKLFVILLTVSLIFGNSIPVFADLQPEISDTEEAEESADLLADDPAEEYVPEDAEFAEEEAEAENEEDYAYFEYTPRSAEDYEDPFSFVDGNALLALETEAEGFPDSFDLRNVDINGDGSVYQSFVTPVKVQNPYGTCWGFAAISAAESSLIASGLADDTVDLSEKHLAYFAMSHIDDPSDPQNGEGIFFNGLTDNDIRTSAYRYDTGGTTLYATLLFASGIGPILEYSADPVTGESLEGYFAYRGANAERSIRRVAIAYDEDGNPTQWASEPVWYSSDDDWSIPEQYRFCQNYRLKDSYVLPGNYAFNYDDYSVAYSEDGINAIKQQMYKYHRAVSVNFCAESYLPGQDTSGKQFMSSHWAHYVSTPEMSNHAVTIVGWDDNYPKENFLTEPDGDGAFLIKNSWGSELNEFPNNGFRHWGLLEGQDGIPYDSEAEAVSDRATGYFWLSYYDRSISDPEAFEFDCATDGSDYVIGQMDFLQSAYMDGYDDGSECKSANVFTSPGTLELKEISVMTLTPGTEVSYEIYLLPDDYKDPEDGIKIAEGSGEVFEYGGYHRICLDTPKILTRNQKYSVIVTQTAEDGDYIPFASYKLDNSSYMYSNTVVNEGESFCYTDSQWEDISDSAVQEKLLGRTDKRTDNFPIKTYLEYINYQDGDENNRFDGYLTISNWQEGTPGSFDVYYTGSKTLTAEFRGISQNMPADWDPAVTWTSDNESVVQVTPAADNCGEAVITGMSEGSAIITADAGEFGIRLIRVNVSKSRIDSVSLNYDDYDVEYTGKPFTPELDSIWADDPEDPEGFAKLIEGVDYTVEYRDNIDAGTATVVVTGTGRFSGEATENFTIHPKKVTPAAELSEYTYVYDRSVHKPTVSSVTADETALSSDEYTVSYSDKSSKNAGVYTVKIKLKGNYEGSSAVK